MTQSSSNPPTDHPLNKEITELLEEVQSGDKKHLKLLIHKLHEEFQTRLKERAKKRIGLNLAYNHEDLASDCFEFLIRWLQGTPQRKFGSRDEVWFYLLRVLHYRSLENFRTSSRYSTGDLHDPPEIRPLDFDFSEVRDLFDTALRRVPAESLPLLRDYVQKDMSLTDLKQAHKCTLYKVKKTISEFKDIIQNMESSDERRGT